MEALQFERLAPKSEARVRPPVDEALVKYRLVAVKAVDEAIVNVVVAKVEAPATLSVPVKLAVEEIV